MEPTDLGHNRAAIKACLFDAYGTLLDFAAADACPQIPPAQRAAFLALWREKQLSYTWLRTLQDEYVDFAQVTADAAAHALATLGLDPTPAERSALLAHYHHLPVFAEVQAALAALAARGLRLAILSNGTQAMLHSALAGAGLGQRFDPIVSADQVRRYKTHPSLYAEALRQLDLPGSAVLFVSANGWDAQAAAAFGMRSVWINRAGAAPEALPGRPDAVVADLGAVAALLG